MDKVMALSINQPWAMLIAMGIKDIENRNWDTGFRGKLYIHAGRDFDWKALNWLFNRGMHKEFNMIVEMFGLDFNFRRPTKRLEYFEAIIGTTVVDDMTLDYRWQWVVIEGTLLDKPIPMVGGKHLFEIDKDKLNTGDK